MSVTFFLRLLAVVSAETAHKSWKHDLRVYKGEMDVDNDFPFAVLLQMAQKPFLRICSGSLLAENWVLTAGHCVAPPNIPPFIIRIANFTAVIGAYSKPLKIYIHPSYIATEGVTTNDIALILVEKIPDKKYGKLLALDYKTLYGLPVKYAGFGSTSEDVIHKNVKQIVKDLKIPIQVGEGVAIPCRKIPFKYGPAVCIAPRCSRSTQNIRPGDSGGPLVYDKRIIGVAMSVAIFPAFAYYTPVSPYLEWIKRVIQSEGNFRRG